MVMFFPIQQELDCINSDGRILGKIQFDSGKGEFVFRPESDSLILSNLEQSKIDDRVQGLTSGKYSISMQDDD